MADQPAEQQQQQEKSWDDVAREHFGNDFHDPDAQAEVSEEPKSKALTLDQAYERMQEAKDEAALQREQAAKPKPAPQRQEAPEQDDSGDDGAMWSNDDVQAMTVLQREWEQFRQDVARYQENKAIDIDQWAGGDRDKAKVARLQLRQTEQELLQRQQALQQYAQSFQGKAVQQQSKKIQKVMKAEKAKLAKEAPDFDPMAARAYLASKGFKDAEIDSVQDHRLAAMVWKAKRFDEMVESPKKVPKFIPGARPKPQRRLSKGQLEVQQAMQRLKETGKLDDAVALMSAQRRARGVR